MPLPKIDRKAAKRSFWGALGRLIGVMMGAGAGSLIARALGSSAGLDLSVALFLTAAGFFFIWLAEYEREIE